MRSDTRKTDIKRRYQKLMEFYADSSSLLIGLYEILLIVLGYINTFYTKYSISNKLFLFKEIEGTHFDVSKNIQRIKNIMDVNGDIKLNETDANMENDPNYLENIKKSKIDEVIIYNSKNKGINQNIDKNLIIKPKMKKKGKIKKRIKLININLEDSQKDQMKSNNIEIASKSKIEEKKENGEIKQKQELNIEGKLKYSFNVCEILNILIWSCCMTKKLRVKNDLNEKAVNILNNKLDIVLYIRNMILFDILNETLLDESKKSIINFLCRPILSINKDEENMNFIKITEKVILIHSL